MSVFGAGAQKRRNTGAMPPGCSQTGATKKVDGRKEFPVPTDKKIRKNRP